MLITDLTEEEIQARLKEIEADVADVKRLKRENRLSSEDIEDVSDNYQYHIEWNEYLSELQFEYNELVKARNALHTL